MTLSEFLYSLAEDSQKVETFNASPESAAAMMDDADLSASAKTAILANDTEAIYQALLAEGSAATKATAAATAAPAAATALRPTMMFLAPGTMMRFVKP
jgi:hypothetical protein